MAKITTLTMNNAARKLGRGVARVQWWFEGRGANPARWPVYLVRLLPVRGQRLGQTVAGASAEVSRLVDESGQAYAATGPAGLTALLRKRRVSQLWLLVAATRLFDLLGGPEAFEWLWRGLTAANPLTPAEQAAGIETLGHEAVRWRDVRVAQGGMLKQVFRRNGNRAFTLWHTVNLPVTGAHTRDHVDVLIHELLHVYQYERCGSAYIVEALHAQRRGAGYDYGRAAGLIEAMAAGKRFCDFNREQQGQIVQDYFSLLHLDLDDEDDQRAARRQEQLICYEPFIRQARAGEL